MRTCVATNVSTLTALSAISSAADTCISALLHTYNASTAVTYLACDLLRPTVQVYRCFGGSLRGSGGSSRGRGRPLLKEL